MNNRIVLIGFPKVVLLVTHIGQFLNVRLQLFQQDQAKCYESFRVDFFQVLGVLDGINIKEDVVLALQYRRIFLYKWLNEFCKEQDDLAVTITNADHLF